MGNQEREKKMEYLDEIDQITINNPTIAPLKAQLANKRRFFAFKRCMDVCLALVGAVLTIPFIILVGLAIKIEERNLFAKVLFIQERVGKDGKLFKMIKFRSMHEDAEERLKDLLTQNEIKGAMFKIKQDPRVTKVGRFIRKTSIDELPQFFNVLVGDMSLIGPRPPLMREVVQYKDLDKARLLVKPGITGLWQATLRNDADFDTMVKLDIQYIKNLSIKNDLKIVKKTIWVMIHPNGAY